MGRDPFKQNSNRSDLEKWSTSQGGTVYSKLFWLDRTFWTEISGNSRPWSTVGGALRHETTEPANFLERTLYMTPQTVYRKTKWRTNCGTASVDHFFLL